MHSLFFCPPGKVNITQKLVEEREVTRKRDDETLARIHLTRNDSRTTLFQLGAFSGRQTNVHCWENLIYQQEAWLARDKFPLLLTQQHVVAYKYITTMLVNLADSNLPYHIAKDIQLHSVPLPTTEVVQSLLLNDK